MKLILLFAVIVMFLMPGPDPVRAQVCHCMDPVYSYEAQTYFQGCWIGEYEGDPFPYLEVTDIGN